MPLEWSVGFSLCLHFLENGVAETHFLFPLLCVPLTRWNSLLLSEGCSFSAVKTYILCLFSQLKCAFVPISFKIVSLFLVSPHGISVFSLAVTLRITVILVPFTHSPRPKCVMWFFHEIGHPPMLLQQLLLNTVSHLSRVYNRQRPTADLAFHLCHNQSFQCLSFS